MACHAIVLLLTKMEAVEGAECYLELDSVKLFINSEKLVIHGSECG